MVMLLHFSNCLYKVMLLHFSNSTVHGHAVTLQQLSVQGHAVALQQLYCTLSCCCTSLTHFHFTLYCKACYRHQVVHINKLISGSHRQKANTSSLIWYVFLQQRTDAVTQTWHSAIQVNTDHTMGSHSFIIHFFILIPAHTIISSFEVPPYGSAFLY